MIEQEFRDVLKKARKDKKLTLNKLGEMTGTMPHLIGYYEKGSITPSMWKTEDILNAIGYKFEIVPIDTK